MSDIEFEKDGHVYKVGGKIMPSVTEIIRAVRPDHQFYTRRSGERGTQIHKALQYFDEGRLDECPSEYMGYLSAYEFFKDSADWMPLEHNVRVYHEELNYCGTMDVVGLYSGARALLDFKSGAPNNSHLVQVAAYGMAAGIDVRFVLYLKPTGQFSLVPGNGEILNRMWLSHLDVYNWYRR